MSIEVLQGDSYDEFLRGVPDNCRFLLDSERVILLTEPFTEEEYKAAQHPDVMAILERMADEMVRKAGL